MNKYHLNEYVKTTERMVLPDKVAKVNQASSFMSRLPLKWQKGIAQKGAKTNPYMGFIVEPYSFFLSYEISDIEAVQSLIPPNYTIVPSSMFKSTRKRPIMIIGAFNVHTSVFWGSRVELYVIAENRESGLLSWIIIDYETNTNSFDPGTGFRGATTQKSIVTTTFQGDVIVDVQGQKSGHGLSLSAPVKSGYFSSLDQKLWVEGNLSVDYGGELSDGISKPFGLIFDPAEMKEALQIPLGQIDLNRNSFCGEWTLPNPVEACCFPFAQHFITTSVPMGTGIHTSAELERAALRFSGHGPKRPNDQKGAESVNAHRA